MSPPIDDTMYMDSSRPRVALVAMSLSHDSTTTKTPAMHTPNTNRKRAHAVGLIHKRWRMDTPEAIEANAANTRIWPTAARKCSARRVPIKNPKKKLAMTMPLTARPNPSDSVRTPSSTPWRPPPT